MRGLLVVGAGAAEVAADLATAMDGELREVIPRSDGSPHVVARHGGRELDPNTLVQIVRSAANPVVAVAETGLLAAITPRFTVRDLAAQLGLPVIVSVRPDGDMVNLARLTLYAARAARIAVPTVVIAGWPNPPSRSQLDERRLLADTSPVPVRTLVPGAAREWPVGDWMSASAPAVPDAPPVAPAAPVAPAPAAAPAATGAEVVLEPYGEWTPRPLTDPRSTPRPRIMEAMLEIIGAEGPMRATRAYALYNRASGGKKLTTIARAPLSSAVYWLAQERKITLVKRDEIPWQDDDLVRLPDTPPVRVRELGSRTLEDVPLDEIAELMRRLRDSRGLRSHEELKRAVLQTYGLVRLTTRADEYLGLAIGLMES